MSSIIGFESRKMYFSPKSVFLPILQKKWWIFQLRNPRDIREHENFGKMMSDETLAKRRKVAVLHQANGLFQNAIVKQTGFGYRLVRTWMNVPCTSPDRAFGRWSGGVNNAQKFDEKVLCAFSFREKRYLTVLALGRRRTHDETRN